MDGGFGAGSTGLRSDMDNEHMQDSNEQPLVKHIDVDEKATCPVKDKDIDERTIAALAVRGIENFTPVQVSDTLYGYGLEFPS